MIGEEDKVTLMRERAELVESLATLTSNEDRVRVQCELSVVNAKIKALNTTEAARLKAVADRRRTAGLAEAQSNAARAATKGPGSWPSSAPGEPGFGDPINKRSIRDRVETPGDDEDDDPGQTAAIDAWIDAVLVRHDIDFTRSRAGTLAIAVDSDVGHAVLWTLIDGIYAAARGQELPPLPTAAPKSQKSAKSKKR
jgi:hypothetical protein